MKVTVKGLGLVTPASQGKTADTTDLTSYAPPRKLRRIDHFTRMTLLAAYRALEDATMLDPLPENMGIVLSTGYGPAQTTFDFLDSIIDDGAPLASPLAFSHSVHNIPAGVLSMLLGKPCPQTTICQLRSPVSSGLQMATVWLAEKRVDTVLFGCVDETTPLLAYNLRRLDQKNTSEGAAFFVLDTGPTGLAHIEMGRHLVDSKQHQNAQPTATAFALAEAVLTIQGTLCHVACPDGRIHMHVTGIANG